MPIHSVHAVATKQVHICRIITVPLSQIGNVKYIHNYDAHFQLTPGTFGCIERENYTLSDVARVCGYISVDGNCKFHSHFFYAHRSYCSLPTECWDCSD